MQTGGAVSGWTAFDVEQVPMAIVALPRKGMSGVGMTVETTWRLQHAGNLAEKLQ
jgi:hypothetical protein